MRYYIRHTKDAEVEGPFSLKALNESVQLGTIPVDAWASSDLGEDVSRLRSWRGCDWFPLTAIGEFRHLAPPAAEPVPKERPSRLFSFVLSLVMTISFSLTAVEKGSLFWAVPAVLAGAACLWEIVEYFRKRLNRDGKG